MMMRGTADGVLLVNSLVEFVHLLRCPSRTDRGTRKLSTCVTQAAVAASRRPHLLFAGSFGASLLVAREAAASGRR